ncbi:hypothetical protein CC78DRAFT_93645 [Lojkania enalia]|uniref:Tail specific protease domain-containing protein n=1 Tax=Lojkania enalia TaxID=147567 RepID=A0A9P4N7S9_9PLEO|nr:hypothetical protein CC78DRAFT_93645 [Didymosphaeria enalia]
MRSMLVLSVLIAAVAAQETFVFSISATRTRGPTETADNIEPSATETVTGPISTESACAQISEYVQDSEFEYPSVEAELAYACLQSVPIDEDAASLTISSLKNMVQFQSTLEYLNNPPEGYFNDPVDIMAGLDDIGNKVDNGEYNNEYDFENDIAELMVKAHDGHLGFDGMAYGGVFRWRRSRQVMLISASSDGEEVPKVWAVQDFNKTGDAGFIPSAVSKIDGKDAVQFLEEEALLNSYHDPDTRYNAMFYLQPAESFGLFTSPRFYPGPTMNMTFENGTEHTYVNLAVVLDASYWRYVDDGASFYQTFVNPSLSFKKRDNEKINPYALPHKLQFHREAELATGYVPAGYPDPAIMHSAYDVALAGYFVDTPAGTVGVLMVQTFNTESNSDAVEFQAVVQDYISQAQSRNIEKHIIDVRNNGGGKVMLGYDMYLQFFPSQEPQLQSRYRIHNASSLFGEQISSLRFSQSGSLFTSPFNYHSFISSEEEAFTSWDDMDGPETFNGDQFTQLLKYNLSDPLTASSDIYSIGVEMTGYGDRDNFTTDPFRAEDIIILSDGICASTCALFTELMVQQSGVKTLAVGGRPVTGPMQPVGGTKGSLVLTSDYLASLSYLMVSEFATPNGEAREWAKFLPDQFGILPADATINFQDNIRKGLESDGMPTQFLNDTASCRMWYEPNDYLNVTRLWVKAAEIAFGNDGGLDQDRCVPGSATTEEQQQGQGEGNPTTSNPEETPAASTTTGAAAPLYASRESGWRAVVVCGAVIVGSMIFGASLI